MNNPKLSVKMLGEDIVNLYIYDDIVDNDANWWTGAEHKSSSKYIAEQLDNSPTAERINVYINSDGGSVKEGLAIYQLLKRHPAKVCTFVDGFACSIASLIAMAGDEIVIGENALMMIHHAWTYACGNPAELRKAADDLEVIDKAATETYLERSGGRLDEETLGILLDKETWLNARQCIEYGLADKIANVSDSEKKAQARLFAAKNAAMEDGKESLKKRNEIIKNALFSVSKKINGGFER